MTLEVEGLVKSYGSLRAVDGVSFTLAPGQVLGLLGPNGAGKTTTVALICGQMRPDAGSVRFGGRPLEADDDLAKRTLGVVPQELALYEELKGIENLRFFGGLYGLGGRALEEAAAEALAFVGLTDRGRDRVKHYSGGMKRRLNLAAALLHDPQVLLLDEPTVGVDPQSRNAIFENLEALRARGKALLYTTHYMEEAERLCDRLVILDHGRVIASGTHAALATVLPAGNRLEVELAAAGGDGWLEGVAHLPGVESAVLDGTLLTLRLRDLSSGAPAVLAYLAAHRVPCAAVRSGRAGLEEIFLALTGRGLRDV